MAKVSANELPLAGATVLQVRVDYAFTLVLKQADDAYEVRIEQAFEFADADGKPHALDPEGDPVRLGVALGCARTTVVAASASEDGRLRLAFGDGSLISVPGSAEYEGWTLTGAGGLRIVAGPGPGLTVWSAEP